jgi:hypothetical protein
MTTYSMHLINATAVLWLVQRVDRILANADLTAWKSLHESLSQVRPPPRLSNDSLWVDSEPITRCSYHFSAKMPDLVAEQLPERRSINRVMRSLVEITARERCEGGFSKFASDYNILINEHVLSRHRKLADAHQRFIDLVLAAQQSEIPELEFLRIPDAYGSVTRAETLAAFLDQHSGGEYLATSAETFLSMPDIFAKIFGSDIRRMEWFLRAAAMRTQGAAVWFNCFAT